MNKDYLVNHCALRTSDLDACREVASRFWVRHRSQVVGRGQFFFMTNHAALANVGLTYFRYSPMQLEAEEPLDQYVVALHESGHSEHFLNRRPAMATPSQAVLFGPGQKQSISMPDARALALHLRPRFFETALAQRFRRWPPLHEWASELRLDGGPLATLRALCRWAADELDRADSGLRTSPKAIGHLECALRGLLMDAIVPLFPWDQRDEPAIEPRYLRLIEDWMDANLEDPIEVDDLARIAGVGVRAVQVAFRRYRGCTPLGAVLQRRLHRARALLLHPLPDTTVTGVALTVGHFHLGRFATRYRLAFGESPSETLAHGLRRV